MNNDKITCRVKNYFVICVNSRPIRRKIAYHYRYSSSPLPMPKKNRLSIISLYSTENRIITLNFTLQFHSTYELTIFIILCFTEETASKPAEMFFTIVQFPLCQIHLSNWHLSYIPQNLYGICSQTFRPAIGLTFCVPPEKMLTYWEGIKELFSRIFET